MAEGFMKRTCSFLTIAFFIFAIGATAQAQILAWDTEGSPGDEPTFNSTTTNPNLITSSLSRGVGVTGCNVNDTFCSQGYTPLPILAGATAARDYMEFSIHALSGSKV